MDIVQQFAVACDDSGDSNLRQAHYPISHCVEEATFPSDLTELRFGSDVLVADPVLDAFEDQICRAKALLDVACDRQARNLRRSLPVTNSGLMILPYHDSRHGPDEQGLQS